MIPNIGVPYDALPGQLTVVWLIAASVRRRDQNSAVPPHLTRLDKGGACSEGDAMGVLGLGRGLHPSWLGRKVSK